MKSSARLLRSSLILSTLVTLAATALSAEQYYRLRGGPGPSNGFDLNGRPLDPQIVIETALNTEKGLGVGGYASGWLSAQWLFVQQPDANASNQFTIQNRYDLSFLALTVDDPAHPRVVTVPRDQLRPMANQPLRGPNGEVLTWTLPMNPSQGATAVVTQTRLVAGQKKTFQLAKRNGTLAAALRDTAPQDGYEVMWTFEAVPPDAPAAPQNVAVATEAPPPPPVSVPPAAPAPKQESYARLHEIGTSHVVNVESKDPRSTDYKAGWHSAQWVVEEHPTPAGVALAFRNRWTSQYLAVVNGDLRTIGGATAEAQWLMVAGPNSVALKNVAAREFLVIVGGQLALSRTVDFRWQLKTIRP